MCQENQGIIRDGVDENRTIYDESWSSWEDMKRYGPASRWHRWLIAEILKTCGLGGIGSVLDFGCGNGVTTQFLSELFPDARMTGCDISRAGIEMARQRGGGEIPVHRGRRLRDFTGEI